MPTGVYSLVKKINIGIELRSMPFLKENARYRDLHKGKRCFILCCGPSINRQNLLPLKDEISFSVSNFYFHKDYNTIRPRYHCVPGIGSSFSEGDVVRWFKEMDGRIGNAEVFLHVAQRSVVEKYNLFHSRKVNYLYMTNNLEITEDVLNLIGEMPGVQSVPIMCLMIALYMGFKEIYLLGVEHDSYKTNRYEYFFEEKLACGQDESVDDNRNIIHSEYINLLCYLNLWTQYRALKRIAAVKGASIYNATAGGVLDEFERVNYDSLFELH